MTAQEELLQLQLQQSLVKDAIAAVERLASTRSKNARMLARMVLSTSDPISAVRKPVRGIRHTRIAWRSHIRVA